MAKKQEVLTIEEMVQRSKENQQKQQEEFAHRVLEDIQWWNEKANKKDYKPTLEEQKAFIQAYRIMQGMNNLGLITATND